MKQPTKPNTPETVATHTPEWTVSQPTGNVALLGRAEIKNRDGLLIAHCDVGMYWHSNAIANARLIVRAVNSHADLVAACRFMLSRSGAIDQSATHDGLTNADALARIRTALAKATAE
jgi:hypothetical protein